MSNKVFKHIALVSKHKWTVFKLCCRVGIPWRGLVHDLSKFSPTEFLESIKYYTGTISPIKECRKVNGYSMAWVHHVNKNKHHYQHWVDWGITPKPVIMPYKYVAEMICDKIAAGIVYEGKNWTESEPIEYYLKERESALIHERIDKVLLEVFTQLKDNGIKKTLKRKNIKAIYNKYCKNV
ncbi:MAG: catalase [Clostridia bacterium]|nr:catalase [Clostridia bacterium]